MCELLGLTLLDTLKLCQGKQIASELMKREREREKEKVEERKVA